MLQLGNPFADMFGGAAPTTAPNGAGAAAAAGGNNMWMGNGIGNKHLQKN